MPKMGDGMESGLVLAWKYKDGDTVNAGDVIADVETDKANIEIEAEDSGVFHAAVDVGKDVPVGTVIATIGEGSSVAAVNVVAAATPAPAAAQAAVPAAAEGKPSSAPSPKQVLAPDSSRVKASPLARSVARSLGIELKNVRGTGPQGRITEVDVRGYKPTVQAALPAASKPAPPALPIGEGSLVEFTNIRRVIARRMVQSKTTIPHFYCTMEVDMAEAMSLREKLNAYDDTLPKISLNDMLVKACGKALAKFPVVNRSVRGEQVYVPDGIHVGIAVTLDDGLIVPVVRNVDKISLRDVTRASRELIQKARHMKLLPADYTGGSFTVSNLGSLGMQVETFTAIIDPAQGAILAASSIIKKAVVTDNDQIVIQPRMSVTFSGDHRVIDGATGARFLNELKRYLQNPLSLLE
jgi:pyruvate dehydrogenase E2 component (dihydrolipoamide acetyltransferase)